MPYNFAKIFYAAKECTKFLSLASRALLWTFFNYAKLNCMRSSTTRSPPAQSLELFIVLPHTLSGYSQHRCARSPTTHSLVMRTLWRCSGRRTLSDCAQSHCEQSPTTLGLTAHELWLCRFMVSTFWLRTISRRTHWNCVQSQCKNSLPTLGVTGPNL